MFGGRRAGGGGRERARGRSRAAIATLVSGVAFLAAGAASGQLIDQYGGVLGAIEWLLRTLVVIAAVVFIVAGAVVVLRVRRRVRPRPLGWLLAAVAFVVFLWFVAVPVGYSVYLTHLPLRVSVSDVDLGARKELVTLSGADGVRLTGWYVPSRNRAAVIALHGTGSSRVGVVGHARILARHGYGVLALDLRGHGDSGGRSTSAPWKNDEDMDAAVEWLAARADVDPRRVGMLGVSHGAEVSLRTAARRRDVRAVVAEGAMGGPGDASAAGASPPVVAQLRALFTLAIALTGETATDDAELVERIAPRPLLLISAGRTTEANANRNFQRRGGATTEHWNLPNARHAVARRTEPREYERRVIEFLDGALSPSEPQR